MPDDPAVRRSLGDRMIQIRPDLFFSLDEIETFPYCVEDAIRAADNIARFGGHGRRWTVGDHLRAGAYLLRHDAPKIQSGWVLHDLHEPFCPGGDVPAPLKRRPELQVLVEYEHRIQDAFLSAVTDTDTATYAFHPLVKQIDLTLLAWEAKTFLDADLDLPEWAGVPQWAKTAAEKVCVDLVQVQAIDLARILKETT